MLPSARRESGEFARVLASKDMKEVRNTEEDASDEGGLSYPEWVNYSIDAVTVEGGNNKKRCWDGEMKKTRRIRRVQESSCMRR